MLKRHQNDCNEYNATLNAVPHVQSTPPMSAWHRVVNLPVFSKLGRARKRKRPGTPRSPPPGVSDDDMSLDPPFSTATDDQTMDDLFRTTERQPAVLPEQEMEVQTPDEPPLRSRRPNRGKLPARYADMLPLGTAAPSDTDDLEPDDGLRPPLSSAARRIRKTLRSARNALGLSRLYVDRPCAVPNEFAPLSDGTHPLVNGAAQTGSMSPPSLEEAIAPYPNFSSFLFNDWFWRRRQKSREDRRDLQRNVLHHPDFKSDDLRGVNFDSIDRKIASDGVSHSSLGHGWRSSTVHLRVPHGLKRKKSSRQRVIDPELCIYDIHGILNRSIPKLIEEVFSKPSAANFHYTPYELVWKRPDSDNAALEENVYFEVFNSPAFIEEHEALQSLPPEPGCDLPRAVAAFMGMSDAGHLTDTGGASIHPFNGMFGNQPKAERIKPSNRAVYPIAYFRSLPINDLRDFISDMPGGKARKKDHPIFTHLRRELMHEVLGLVFDDEFWYAYDHGIVVNCADGVRRRLYPRLFVYIADYPEKCNAATIRDQGDFPCPGDLTPDNMLDQMGTAPARSLVRDSPRIDTPARRKSVRNAQKLIHNKGYAVNSKKVDALLKAESYTPTQNALSDRHERYNVFSMFLPDPLHEIGGGTWLATLRHLIRILQSLPDGDARIIELNKRFRDVSPFGRDSVRQLSDHITDLTQMRIHEYETILKDAGPCFEALFPDADFDAFVQTLLFTFAFWHSSAKLAMHTDSSLRRMDQCTQDLGNMMRYFQITSAERYPTLETEAEAAKRVRQAQARGKTVSGARKPKFFNLATYKFHSMDHYVPGITRIGTTDNYTTAICEASLQEPNDDYQRTSKRDFEIQVIGNAIRKQVHFDMRTKLARLGVSLKAVVAKKDKQRDPNSFTGEPTLRYHIAKRDGARETFRDLRSLHALDPAFRDFSEKLRHHCLARLAGLPSTNAQLPSKEYSLVKFDRDSIWPHSRIAFNYTTYDVRRAQDPVGTTTKKRDIMILSPEHGDSGPPYYYARVLGVFHVKVRHPTLSRKYERMDVLHVRWFRTDPTFEAGWAARRLDCIEFLPSSNSCAFGFVDPARVVRGVHLIPAFAHGRTSTLLRSPVASVAGRPQDGDWRYYYVARFADCDMMMRYTDLGIGHHGARPNHIDPKPINMREPDPFPEITHSTAAEDDDEWEDEIEIIQEPVLETIQEEEVEE
ncbi:hypothetical protein EXIGLDRAFT_764538 [Exidia glandulosa HHB12029]|uniref:Uncharacterized protein n=1 Tax=Exidia glandulosa HHB12029 TaxID=1314781 RepID=A0A165L2E5_EXIGL|nr:hypothetical protein EXIGLDRAFT_764538 [Exidia glandulosa HHB12029]